MDYSKWVPWFSLGVASLALYRSFRQDRKLAKESMRLESRVVYKIPETNFCGFKLTITNTGHPEVSVLAPVLNDMNLFNSEVGRFDNDLKMAKPLNPPTFPIALRRGQQASLYYRVFDLRQLIRSPESVARISASVRTSLGTVANCLPKNVDFPMLLDREERQVTGRNTTGED